jgi:hypothetical protein
VLGKGWGLSWDITPHEPYCGNLDQYMYSRYGSNFCKRVFLMSFIYFRTPLSRIQNTPQDTCYQNVLSFGFVFVFVCGGSVCVLEGGGAVCVYITSYEPYCVISTRSLRSEIWSRNHKG